MSTPRPAPVSGIGITAIALGAVSLLGVLILFPGLKIIFSLVGVAAVIVGVLAAMNARRTGGQWIAPAVGAALGAVALVAMIVFVLILST
ncbi:hypothetical protein [Microbacterium testaceum]|uniref:hypothetical protein n=1 Tax=Microbacterium testaceum TaxID=2033 RepID=UPI002434C310|nr:hypothetical protein [Microbacterium testaceum]